MQSLELAVVREYTWNKMHFANCAALAAALFATLIANICS